MLATLDDRLRALGDDLLAASTPITRDDLHDVVTVRSIAPLCRRGRFVAAAVLAAAAALIAVVVVTTRPDDHHSIGAPSTDGRMLLDPVPDGWKLTGIDTPRLEEHRARAHLYERVGAGETAQVAVRVFDARWHTPYVPDQHRTVTIADNQASIYDENDIAGHRAVSYKVDGSWVVVATTGLTDDELIALAAGVMIDDAKSGSIAPESLPAGFTDLGMAWQRMVGFVTDTAGLNAGPNVDWRSGERSFGFYSVPGEASATLLTFFADTVASTRVRGTDASLVTVANGPELLGIVWAESGRTYFASGYQISRDELLDLVGRLSAATDKEWDSALASLRPPVATIDPATGLPTPGAAIRTRVTQFPVVPVDALTRLGNPSPFAQYAYPSAGVDHPGSLWEGAIGPDEPASSADDIVVTVADPGNAETPPAEPGRTPTITEYDYGDGVELFTARDGFTVVVRGTDKDVLYDVIDLVQPRVAGGVLAGYDFSGALPVGLIETAAPYRQGFESGSFPVLMFNGGALSVEVRLAPLANLLADDLTDFSTFDTSLGTAYVVRHETSESPAGGWVRAHVGLADGSTLTLETSYFSVDEVVALIDSLQLVTQAEWEATYGPMPAIVYGSEAGGSGATATTAAEATG